MNSPIARHHKILGFALGLAFTFVLLAGILGLVAVLAPAAGSELLGAAPPQAAVTPTISGEMQCAKLYPLDGRGSAAAQQAQQKRYDTCVQAYNTRLTPKPVPPVLLTLEAPKTIVAPTSVVPRTPAGAGTIIDIPVSPLGPMYIIENSWTSETNGRKYLVFAGAERQDGPPQPRSTMEGIVVVWVSTLDGEGLHEGGSFTTPVKKGPVRVVGGQGQRLVLRADDGTTFYFDVASYRFVSSLTESVPTATVPPAPTGRPYPGP